jgi:hypothetical protein
MGAADHGQRLLSKESTKSRALLVLKLIWPRRLTPSVIRLMKEPTVHSLVIARALLERAEPLCHSDDRYLASAGLVVLQDALEGVFYALLIELDVDETKNLERKSFDELIGELKEARVVVPKSGTLKALNKQRVQTKHYAQVAEPITVRNYFAAAVSAIDFAVRKVTGSSIRDLFIADLLKDGEAKSHLKEAERAITQGRFLEALLETRKAIFVEFEEDYSIYGWRDYDGKTRQNALADAMRGGWNAPAWKRNKAWIDVHVKVPTDYVQIDLDNWRIQAMEYGIHTVELQNLRRLTPDVFRTGRKAMWSYTYDARFPANNANEPNARYCLDRAVSIILKKQEHAGARREPTKDLPFDPPPIYVGRVVYERPATDSAQVHIVAEGYTYRVHREVGGFNPAERFYEITAESDQGATNTLLGSAAEYYRGYLQILPEDG